MDIGFLAGPIDDGSVKHLVLTGVRTDLVVPCSARADECHQPFPFKPGDVALRGFLRDIEFFTDVPVPDPVPFDEFTEEPLLAVVQPNYFDPFWEIE
jgi:hypothetical protein